MSRVRIKTYPYQSPGLGMALLGFCAWLMFALFKACVVVAKWTVVAVVALVALVAGWIEERRAR